MKPALPITLLTFAGLVLGVTSANAAIVFADNFEAGTAGIVSQQAVTATPDVLTYTLANTSRNYNTSLWVDSTVGFGADRQGLIDGGTGGTDFGLLTPDAAGPQAYAFRYTNSGLTSDVGVIGSLAFGQTITVTFDLTIDGWDSKTGTNDPPGVIDIGTSLGVSLVTFDPEGTSATRVDLDSGGPVQNTTSYLFGGDFTLVDNSGTGGVNQLDGGYYTFSFSYVVGDDVIDADGAGAGTSTTFDPTVIGHDIGIRFKGATTSATLDNVSVSIVIPEPSTALAGLLLGLGLLRRRR